MTSPIARDAAERCAASILGGLHEKLQRQIGKEVADKAYSADVLTMTAIIQSHLAQAIKESGAIEALEKHTESYEGEGCSVVNQDVKQALLRLRTLSGEGP